MIRKCAFVRLVYDSTYTGTRRLNANREALVFEWLGWVHVCRVDQGREHKPLAFDLNRSLDFANDPALLIDLGRVARD